MNFLQILVTNKKDFKIEREKPQTKWAWSLLIKCPWVTSGHGVFSSSVRGLRQIFGLFYHCFVALI
jgi:hypothetical protein